VNKYGILKENQKVVGICPGTKKGILKGIKKCKIEKLI